MMQSKNLMTETMNLTANGSMKSNGTIRSLRAKNDASRIATKETAS